MSGRGIGHGVKSLNSGPSCMDEKKRLRGEGEELAWWLWNWSELIPGHVLFIEKLNSLLNHMVVWQLNKQNTLSDFILYVAAPQTGLCELRFFF